MRCGHCDEILCAPYDGGMKNRNRILSLAVSIALGVILGVVLAAAAKAMLGY